MRAKDILQEKLERFIRKYYQNRLIKGVMYGVGLSLGYFFVVATAEYFGHFGSSARLMLLILLIIGLFAIIAYYILYPMAKLMNMGGRITYDKAAILIGKHFPELDDKIINTLQLQKLSRHEGDLIEASIDQRIKTLSPVPFTSAIDLRENRKYWPVLVIPFLVFLGLVVSGQWEDISNSGRRIAAYDVEFVPEAPFNFILHNKDLSVEEGMDIVLELGFSGNSLPAEVEIVLPSGVSRMTKNSDGNYEYKLSNLQEDFDFRFKAAGFFSGKYGIDVSPVPQLRSLILRVEPPTYTGIGSFETEAKLIQDIPEGSQVSWEANIIQAEKAYLIIDTLLVPFERIENQRYKVLRKIKDDFAYSVRTENELVTKTNIFKNRINVIRDEYPQIEVNFAKDSGDASVVYYSGRISDDYGFSGLKLVIKRGDKIIERPLSYSRDGLSQSFGSALVLDSLTGEGTTEIRVYIEVKDNDGINGAKMTRSQEYALSLLGKDVQKEKIDDGYEDYFKSSEENLKQLEEIEKALEEMRRQLMNKKSLSFNEKSKVKELLKKQQELLKQQRKNEELIDKLRRQEEKLEEKNEEIKKEEKAIDKIKNEEEKKLEELMEEIEKLMEDLNMEKLKESLEQMEKLNEQEQKTMERKDELLKDLEFKKDVLEQAQKMEELAKKMEELSMKDEQTAPEELDEQKKVEEEFQKAKEEMDKLKEENKAFEKATEERGLEKQEQEATEEMDKARESLQKQKQQKANESQQKAGEKMQEMSKSLQQSLMQMEASAHQENMEALRQILENLEEVSFGVEELSAKSKIIEAGDPAFRNLLTEQKRLQNGAMIIEDSLFALAKRVPEIEQIVFKEIAAIKTNMEYSIEHLQELQSVRAAVDQQMVMMAANNLALLLDQSLRTMQMKMAQMKPGDQQCQKPGNKPGMSGLKEMQGELGKKMDRMKAGQKKGDGGLSKKELVEILSRQEQLRMALQQMQDKEGSKGNNGSRQKAIEAMEEMEKDLMDGSLSDRYKERLREIETRLLESEKAELEQKKDERRESETAGELKQLYDRELEEYLRERNIENEAIYRMPMNFREYYKAQTSNFFRK